MFKVDTINHLIEKGIPSEIIDEAVEISNINTNDNLIFDNINKNTVYFYAKLLELKQNFEKLNTELYNDIYNSSTVYKKSSESYYYLRTLKNIIDDFMSNNKSFKFSKFSIINLNSVDDTKQYINTINIDDANYHLVEKISIPDNLNFTHSLKEYFIFNSYNKNDDESKTVSLSYVLDSVKKFNKIVLKIYSDSYNINGIKFYSSNVLVDSSTYKVSINKIKDIVVIETTDESHILCDVIKLEVDLLKSYIDNNKQYYQVAVGESYISNEFYFANNENVGYDILSQDNLPCIIQNTNEYRTSGFKDNELFFIPNLSNDGLYYVYGLYTLVKNMAYYIKITPLTNSDIILESTVNGKQITIPMDELIYDMIYFKDEYFSFLEVNIGSIILIKYEPKKKSMSGLFNRPDIINHNIFNTNKNKIGLICNPEIDKTGKEYTLATTLNTYYKNLVITKLDDDTIRKTFRLDENNGFYDEELIIDVLKPEDMYWYLEQSYVKNDMLVRNQYVKLSLANSYIAGSIKVVADIGGYNVVIDHVDAVDDPSLKDNEIMLDGSDFDDKVTVYYQPIYLYKDMDIKSNFNTNFNTTSKRTVSNNLVEFKNGEIYIDSYIVNNWVKNKNNYQHPTLQSIIYTPVKVTLNNVMVDITSIIIGDNKIQLEISGVDDGEEVTVLHHSVDSTLSFNVNPKKYTLEHDYLIMVE